MSHWMALALGVSFALAPQRPWSEVARVGGDAIMRGLARDAIPAIDRPIFIRGRDTRFIRPDEYVIGVHRRRHRISMGRVRWTRRFRSACRRVTRGGSVIVGLLARVACVPPSVGDSGVSEVNVPIFPFLGLSLANGAFATGGAETALATTGQVPAGADVASRRRADVPCYFAGAIAETLGQFRFAIPIMFALSMSNIAFASAVENR
jgi:hypothetical protein